MFYDANLLETPPDWIDFLRMQNNEVCVGVCVCVCGLVGETLWSCLSGGILN